MYIFVYIISMQTWYLARPWVLYQRFKFACEMRVRFGSDAALITSKPTTRQVDLCAIYLSVCSRVRLINMHGTPIRAAARGGTLIPHADRIIFVVGRLHSVPTALSVQRDYFLRQRALKQFILLCVRGAPSKRKIFLVIATRIRSTCK